MDEKNVLDSKRPDAKRGAELQLKDIGVSNQAVLVQDDSSSLIKEKPQAELDDQSANRGNNTIAGDQSNENVISLNEKSDKEQLKAMKKQGGNQYAPKDDDAQTVKSANNKKSGEPFKGDASTSVKSAQMEKNRHFSRNVTYVPTGNVIPLPKTTAENQIPSGSGVSSSDFVKTLRVQPYNGEFQPRGQIQGALGFGSALLACQRKGLCLGPSFKNSLHPVLNMLAPKLDELSCYKRYQLKNFFDSFVCKVGQGSYSDVYKQTFQGRSKVAVKRFKHYSDPLRIYKEVHLLIAVQHPRVVKIHGAFHEGATFMVMELCYGSVRHYLRVLTWTQKIRFAIQLLEALRYIHSLRIIHCDIKPDNVFINSQNNVVLGDFGNAQFLPHDFEYVRIPTDQPCLGSMGYSDYLANSKVYSKSSDIFGVGCTLYEMDTTFPLLDYNLWNAPLYEYRRAVQLGRLIGIPPIITPGEQFDGERETLLSRSCRFSKFSPLLQDMVQHAARRLNANEILVKHFKFLTQTLLKSTSSWQMLDQDPFPEWFVANTGVTEIMQPLKLTYENDLSMNLIYYDSEMAFGESYVRDPKQEFFAVAVDDVEVLFNQLKTRAFRTQRSSDTTMSSNQIIRSTNSVPQSTGDETVTQAKRDDLIPPKQIDRIQGFNFRKSEAPKRPDVASKTVSAKRDAGSKPNTDKKLPTLVPKTNSATAAKAIDVSSKRKQATEMEKSNITASSRKRKKSEALESDSDSDSGNKLPTSPKPKNVYRAAISKAATASASISSKASIRVPESTIGKKLNESKLSLAKRKEKDGLSERNAEKAIAAKPQETRATGVRRTGKKNEDHTSKTNLGKGKPVATKPMHETKTKEWYIRNNVAVPHEIRSPAPSPINIPDDVKTPAGWGGYFDCLWCAYYTHDYLACEEHLEWCEKRPKDDEC